MWKQQDILTASYLVFFRVLRGSYLGVRVHSRRVVLAEGCDDMAQRMDSNLCGIDSLFGRFDFEFEERVLDGIVGDEIDGTTQHGFQ